MTSSTMPWRFGPETAQPHQKAPAPRGKRGVGAYWRPVTSSCPGSGGPAFWPWSGGWLPQLTCGRPVVSGRCLSSLVVLGGPREVPGPAWPAALFSIRLSGPVYLVLSPGTFERLDSRVDGAALFEVVKLALPSLARGPVGVGGDVPREIPNELEEALKTAREVKAHAPHCRRHLHRVRDDEAGARRGRTHRPRGPSDRARPGAGNARRPAARHLRSHRPRQAAVRLLRRDGRDRAGEHPGADAGGTRYRGPQGQVRWPAPGHDRRHAAHRAAAQHSASPSSRSNPP